VKINYPAVYVTLQANCNLACFYMFCGNIQTSGSIYVILRIEVARDVPVFLPVVL
jgi:hypothetical protein